MIVWKQIDGEIYYKNTETGEVGNWLEKIVHELPRTKKRRHKTKAQDIQAQNRQQKPKTGLG